MYLAHGTNIETSADELVRLVRDIQKNSRIIKEGDSMPISLQTIYSHSITYRQQDPVDLLAFEQPSMDNWKSLYNEEDYLEQSN
jgi:hypothetical protein